MRITLGTLNIAGYRQWNNRTHLIAEAVAKLDVDIMLLQEVHFDPAISYENQATLLNRLLTIPYRYSCTTISRLYLASDGRSTRREGLAVLSRYPIEQTETLVLQKAPDDRHDRIVQNVDVAIGANKMLNLTNIHLSNNKNKHHQLLELCKIIDARSERRIIVGDFNIANLHAYRKLFLGCTLSTDKNAYVSYPLENKTFDYFIIPDTYDCKRVSVVDGMSDHSFVSCQLIA